MAQPQPNLKIDTVIFDLDGTLVDTEPAAAAAVQKCFKQWKIEVSPTDAEFVTGRTWDKAFDFLLERYKIPVTRAEATHRVLEAYRDSLEEHLRIVPGGADAVRNLAKRYPLALVSGSYRAEIFYALDRLDIRRHFEVVLGAEDYPNSKPAPDGYLKALEMLGKNSDGTLIFEDSAAGIASARAAGAWVVAISGTNHFKQDTSNAHDSVADLTVVNAEWVENWKPAARI